MANLIRQVMWLNLLDGGAEICALKQAGNNFLLTGNILTVFDEQPSQVQYRITVNKQWQTRLVEVSVEKGSSKRWLHLKVDRQQRWWTSEGELPQLRGCLDVDLGVSPSTNTLPVRRLALSPGSQAEIYAAWVRFPDLEVRPFYQRYISMGRSHYRYESVNFSAEIEVDDLGLVVDYGEWQRLAVY